MGASMSTQEIATIAGLGAGVAVTIIILAIIIDQFVRFRRQQKKKAEEAEMKNDRTSWQARSMEVPYRLGEDVFPSTYPDYPAYPDYPIDYPVEYPVDYPEPPRARFFPVEESPYPMRPCIEPPVIFECDCEPEPQPEHRIIFEPATPQLPPPPPPEPQPIVIYQPLPREPAKCQPQKEIIREIYFPSQPQPLPPPPPRERSGSWCGPPKDDWVLVKKEVKKRKPKKRCRRYEDSDDDDESASSSSSEEEAVSPYNRRLMPYDLAMPRIQCPQMPVQPIYLISQQPAPAPPPAPVPCPVPVPCAVPVPVPVQRNAFFAANVRRFDNRQYEEQEQRANVVTGSYDCDF